MSEQEKKAGYLAAQIEFAQRSIETWPKWLQEVTGVENSEKGRSGDEKCAPESKGSSEEEGA